MRNAFTCTCFDGIPAEMVLSFSKNEFMTLAKIVLYLSSCHSFVTLQIQHSVGHDKTFVGSRPCHHHKRRESITRPGS